MHVRYKEGRIRLSFFFTAYTPLLSTFLSAHFKPCPCSQMRILLYISVVSLKASLHSWIKAALCLLKTLCVDVMPHESLTKQCQLWPNSAPSIKVHGYHCRVNAYMPPALNSQCKKIPKCPFKSQTNNPISKQQRAVSDRWIHRIQ